jgi:adenosylcobinamide amidohydrolase
MRRRKKTKCKMQKSICPPNYKIFEVFCMKAVDVNVDVKIVLSGDFPVAVVKLHEEMEILSSAVINNGFVVSDTLFIMEVPKRYDCADPFGDIEKVRTDLGLPGNAVGFMTAAEVEYVTSFKETIFEGMRTFAVVTAGLSNHVIAGDTIENLEERLDASLEKAKVMKAKAKKIGTINIIGVSPVPLADAAKVNSFIAMTEAKTAAMRALGHEETGTTSDAIAIVSPIIGNREMYCGTGTPLGISLARSVKSAVLESLINRGDFIKMP